jgi:hypothetical protein
MPKDRDQLTPDEPEDAALLAQRRGQGTGGSGLDVLPGEEAELADQTAEPNADDV